MGAVDSGATDPMGVCLVSSASALCPGGISAYVRALTEQLADRDHVSAIARFAQSPPRLLDYASSEPTRVVHCHGRPITIIAPGRGWTPVLRRLKRFLGRPVSSPLAVGSFVRAFCPAITAAIPPGTDVVHVVASGRELIGQAAHRAARRAGAAVVVSPVTHPGAWGDGGLDIDFYRRADRIIALSNFEADHLAALGVARDKIAVSGLGASVVGNGDGRRFRERHGLGGRPVVLFIGRRDNYKGYTAFCGAAALVARVLPDVCFVVMGPGDTTAEAGSESPLLDLRVAPDAVKEDALAACDVFCMPSEGESFGLVYVEAWAYGKAVVTGPAAAARELVEAGGGLSVENTPTATADAVIRLLKDEGLRTRLGTEGRGRQRAEFTWDAVARRHREAYRQALVQRGSSAGRP